MRCKESCSAFRSFFTDRVHRSSGPVPQSIRNATNKWHDTDADGRWYAIASVTASCGGLLADSGWNGRCQRWPPAKVDVLGASRLRVFTSWQFTPCGMRKAFREARPLVYFQSRYGMLSSGPCQNCQHGLLPTWGLATTLTLFLLLRIPLAPSFIAPIRSSPCTWATNLLQTIIGVYLYQSYGFRTVLPRIAWRGQRKRSWSWHEGLATAEICLPGFLEGSKGVWALAIKTAHRVWRHCFAFPRCTLASKVYQLAVITLDMSPGSIYRHLDRGNCCYSLAPITTWRWSMRAE